MKRFQHTLTTAIAAAALLGSLSFSAQAHTDAPQGHRAHAGAHSQGQRAMPKDFAKKHAERMEQLKTVLQIQPSQQAAFDKYVQAITPAPHDATAKTERPDLRKLTTPERLDLAQKLRKERTAKAEQREQATRSFYSSLNANQQKAFDALSARGHKNGKHEHSKSGHPHGPAKHPGAAAAPVAPAA